MQLKNGMNVHNKKTMDILEEMRKKDAGIYFTEDGNVFRRDLDTGKTIEALGPMSKYRPEKCRECAFLIKNTQGGDSLSVEDGEIFYKGGCIMKECVEDIIRDRRVYAISSHKLTKGAKQLLDGAWSWRRPE